MTLTFGEAVEALKRGRSVCRSGWNGKNMSLWLNRGITDRHGKDQSHFDGVHTTLLDDGEEGVVTRLPNINMRSASGATVTGWLASQTDILAEDWMIL